MELTERIQALFTRGNNLNLIELTIDSAEQLDEAAARLTSIKSLLGELDNERKELTRPLDAQKKNIIETFRPVQEKLVNSEGVIKQAILAYERAVEARRAEREAKQQEAARKEAEKLERAAERAEERGHHEKAAVLRDRAEMQPTPIASAPPKKKANGVSSRKTYKAEVSDQMALLRAVVEGKVPETVIKVDMKVLNQLARALNTSMNYPGVRLVEETTIAARAS